MKSLKLFIGSAVSVAAFAALALAKPPEVDVSNDHQNGWEIQATNGSAISFVNGPATPPCGIGSAQFTVGPSTNGQYDTAAQLRNTKYAGTLLSDLTAMSYSTFVTRNNGGQNGNGSQAVYIMLNVDLNGDGVTDDLLFFEPAYQMYYQSNPQAPLAPLVWQTWDAFHGGWYAIDAATGNATYGGPGTNVAPLAGYIAANPGARIVNGSTGLGGVRLVAGFGDSSDWGNFLGNADCFTIGTNKKDMVTYDFEAGKRQGPK
jgi:hypothetical protein